MKIAMVDSNIVDCLLDRQAESAIVQAAITDGRLLLRITHVQQDELAATAEPTRRAALMGILEVVPYEVVATSVFVLGQSRLDQGRLGAGADYTAIRGASRKRVKDAIIADTARGNADVLVSEDGTLRTRANAEGITAWSWSDLVRWAAI